MIFRYAYGYIGLSCHHGVSAFIILLHIIHITSLMSIVIMVYTYTLYYCVAIMTLQEKGIKSFPRGHNITEGTANAIILTTVLRSIDIR